MVRHEFGGELASGGNSSFDRLEDRLERRMLAQKKSQREQGLDLTITEAVPL